MKGPEAFRTISEAADELGVPQHVLRFWETKFSFIRPMKRAGGRRFYRRQDIEVLQGLRVLLHDQGYTIKGVQRLHKEHGVRCVLEAVDHPPPFAAGPSRTSSIVGDAPPPTTRRPRVRKTEEGLEDQPTPAAAPRRLARTRAAASPGPQSSAEAVHSLLKARSHAADDEADLAASDVEAGALAVAASAPAPRTLLGLQARRRLGEVLRDLEATKARLDYLLRG